MASSLLLLEAPFNLTCFQEAVYDFNIDSVYILFPDHWVGSITHNQVKNKLNKLNIKNKELVLINFKNVSGKSLESRVSIYADIINKIKKLDFDFLFFSSFWSHWQEDFINTLRHPKTYILDEGASMLVFLKYHWSRKKIFSIPNLSSEERKLEADRIKTKLGINLKPFNDIYIYTIFKPLLKKNKKIKHNKLNYINKKNIELDSNTEIIIGTSLSSAKLISLASYISFINSIVKNINDEKKIYYAPHRGQDYKHTKELIERIPCLNLLYTDLPIEDWLLEQNYKPVAIHGFLSAAFFILDIILPEITLKCYPLPESYLNSLKNKPFRYSNLYNFHDGVITLLELLPDSIEIVAPKKTYK